ncbi:hypothetical protein [Tateyamaria sp.]|uniref:hypothetical protein n=1 Tax=Tateyamaria sp. TaxID=1929288 RepID=UPI00329C2C63
MMGRWIIFVFGLSTFAIAQASQAEVSPALLTKKAYLIFEAQTRGLCDGILILLPEAQTEVTWIVIELFERLSDTQQRAAINSHEGELQSRLLGSWRNGENYTELQWCEELASIGNHYVLEGGFSLN